MALGVLLVMGVVRVGDVVHALVVTVALDAQVVALDAQGALGVEIHALVDVLVVLGVAHVQGAHLDVMGVPHVVITVVQPVQHHVQPHVKHNVLVQRLQHLKVV